ncbi:SDR family oxidoreductase [Marinomonas communis]|uniref:sulfoacetaldehyde reductase (NADPH) n=1 Tax=Marinomonas communis TaxID=28254 RepID=A0A4R6X0W5_9GAMM|nr:SDR family oxidoreductase [Marinomonas communis]TDR12482.1 NADP-dependent 3-hydroxy acid dehydrogenase YdfG [Marinomonas communis]
MGLIPNYQSALVTGASKGIGRDVSITLASMGLTVHAVARSESSLESLNSEIECQTYALDINDAQALAGVLEVSAPDVIVANAGVLPSVAPYQQMPWDEIEAMITTNLMATMRTVRLALPGMIERNRGHIVIIGSSAALCPAPGVAAYGATKAAIHQFCRALRCDLLGTNVRITEIVPGRVQTNLYHQFLGEEGAQEKLYKGIKSLQPADIAEAVKHIVSAPAHVDIAHYEVMPQMQVMGGSSTYTE